MAKKCMGEPPRCQKGVRPLRAYNPLMQRVSRLILTGFMGAGKSTVGPILAQSLGWKFQDLDHVIEAGSHSSIADIFRNHGEAEFRRREFEGLQQVNQENEVVLA